MQCCLMEFEDIYKLIDSAFHRQLLSRLKKIDLARFNQ